MVGVVGRTDGDRTLDVQLTRVAAVAAITLPSLMASPDRHPGRLGRDGLVGALGGSVGRFRLAIVGTGC
jgi:hypothetical protein